MERVKKRDFCHNISKYLKEPGSYCLTKRDKDEIVVQISKCGTKNVSQIPQEEPKENAVCTTNQKKLQTKPAVQKVDAVGTEGCKVTTSEPDFLEEADKELEEQRARQAEIRKKKEWLATHYGCGCVKKPSMNLCPIHRRI